MTLYRKSVILRDWHYEDPLGLKEPMEASVTQIDYDNRECYLTLTDYSKEDINTKLASLPVMSDRARTLKIIPKYRMIGTKMERIQ